MFIVLSLLIFNLVVPEESKLTWLLSFLLVALLHSQMFLDVLVSWDRILEQA